MAILFLIIGLLGITFFKDTIGSMIMLAVGFIWVKVDTLIDAVTGK